MRGTILYAPGDIRVEERPDPVIEEPSDAVIRTVATCVCGSDLWPYRGIDEVSEPRAIGHEYVGVVEEVGNAPSVPQYLPELLDKVLSRRIEPGRVFDLELPLERAADAYAAMDERRAIKALLRP